MPQSFNYFAGEAIAARYRHARPHFHPLAVGRIAELSGRAHFGRALDVGCGNGDSSVALAELADQVEAVDASAEMLAAARPHERVRYRQGRAEQLDFPDDSFELVTVALALHWFGAEAFFRKCRRVLAPGGLLAVYNDHFTAHMAGLAECKHWMRTRFARRFPQPRRGLRDMDEAVAEHCGFRILQRSSFEHREHYSRSGFVDYLLTRSHTLAPVLAGRESEAEVRLWLEQETSEWLSVEGGEFLFKCNLWLLAAE